MKEHARLWDNVTAALRTLCDDPHRASYVRCSTSNFASPSLMGKPGHHRAPRGEGFAGLVFLKTNAANRGLPPFRRAQARRSGVAHVRELGRPNGLIKSGGHNGPDKPVCKVALEENWREGSGIRKSAWNMRQREPDVGVISGGLHALARSE